jgi:predicted acyl esterase
MDIKASGIEPGQRRLNGPQTTGPDYRNLSQPTYVMVEDDDVPVAMRDGVTLLADVHRPTQPGRYPGLVAASPYPRQIQQRTRVQDPPTVPLSSFRSFVLWILQRRPIRPVASARNPACPSPADR